MCFLIRQNYINISHFANRESIIIMLNIIHLKHRRDRMLLFQQQISEQGIKNYKIWEGIKIDNNPKKGIAMAHKQIVEWAGNQNLSSIIVAEDDIQFTASGAYKYFLENEPESYDLYLGGIVYGKLNSDNSINEFSGLTLYMINQRFYETFLSIPETLDLDRALANRGEYIVCNPFVAIQHDGYSDNHSKYMKYDRYYENRSFFHLK